MQAQEAIRPALEHLVVGVTQIMERVAPLRPVFEAAAAEPGVAEVWLNAERLRLEGYRAIIALLATKQPLAAGHTADSATDIMFVLLGPATFRAFINGRGWLLEQWKAWVTTTLEREGPVTEVKRRLGHRLVGSDGLSWLVHDDLLRFVDRCRGCNCRTWNAGCPAGGALVANVGSPVPGEVVSGQAPIGRPPTVEDVAAAVAYFVSDDAEYVTGQVLNVSGGWML